MKVCTKCGEAKELHSFGIDKSKPDGHRPSCKACVNAYFKAKRDANIEQARVMEAEKRLKYKETQSRSAANWYAANHESELAKRRAKYHENRGKVRERYLANRDAILEYQRKYRAENRERIAATCLAYREANPEVIRACRRSRRARVKRAEGKHTGPDIIALFSRQRGCCAACRTSLKKSGPERFHVDHVIPLALGGTNWPDNLQLLCPTCNLSKGAKHPHEWAKENGRLL